MKKLGKSSKKGFTLVELIVVLVILAVLAAMLVPALIGYIDRAKKEKEFQAASTVYAAVQALATEAYGKDKALDEYDKFTVDGVHTLTGVTVNAIQYSVVDDDDDAEAIDKYTIQDIAIQFNDGETWYTYSLNDKTWEVTTNSTAPEGLTEMDAGGSDTESNG